MEPVARHRADRVRGGAPAGRGRGPGAGACSPRAASVGAEIGNTDTVVNGEAELALLAMDRGRWDEAADRVARALAIVDEYRMHDYAASVLVFAAAARLALHDGDLEEVDDS